MVGNWSQTNSFGKQGITFEHWAKHTASSPFLEFLVGGCLRRIRTANMPSMFLCLTSLHQLLINQATARAAVPHAFSSQDYCSMCFAIKSMSAHISWGEVPRTSSQADSPACISARRGLGQGSSSRHRGKSFPPAVHSEAATEGTRAGPDRVCSLTTFPRCSTSEWCWRVPLLCCSSWTRHGKALGDPGLCCLCSCWRINGNRWNPYGVKVWLGVTVSVLQALCYLPSSILLSTNTQAAIKRSPRFDAYHGI